MKIEYKITEYFNNNNLFDSENTDGLSIKMENNSLIIDGNSKDLVELADILISICKEKNKETHIHIDTTTLVNKNSEIEEIIIQKR